jgi:hypothetical protein
MPGAERSKPMSDKLKDQIDLRSCWPCLRFAITDDTGNNEVRLIHDGTKRNTEGIAQLSALMDTTGNFRIHMAICMVKEEKEMLV